MKKYLLTTLAVWALMANESQCQALMEGGWLACHRQFADTSPKNRQGIIATGSGHVIVRENPPLVIAAIVKAYACTQGVREGDEIRKRFPSYVLEAVNEEKRKEAH